jgi:hypothetical protein
MNGKRLHSAGFHDRGLKERDSPIQATTYARIHAKVNERENRIKISG